MPVSCVLWHHCPALLQLLSLKDGCWGCCRVPRPPRLHQRSLETASPSQPAQAPQGRLVGRSGHLAWYVLQSCPMLHAALHHLVQELPGTHRPASCRLGGREHSGTGIRRRSSLPYSTCIPVQQALCCDNWSNADLRRLRSTLQQIEACERYASERKDCSMRRRSVTRLTWNVTEVM